MLIVLISFCAIICFVTTYLFILPNFINHGVKYQNTRALNITMENVECKHETDNESDLTEVSRYRYERKYFPKLFIRVIYIVILFVSFGTILTQLIIFEKGKSNTRTDLY